MNDHPRWNRRRLLGAALGLAPGALLTLPSSGGLLSPGTALAKAVCALTAVQGEGPFYPRRFGLPGNDLFVSGDGGTPPEGEPIVVSGVVMDKACQPVAGAVVEIWQADSKGRYRLRRGGSDDLDPRFSYWGRAVSGADGRYQFRTILPAAYGSGLFQRTPHIHYKVKTRGGEALTTQMYFPDEPRNEKDFLFNQVPADARQTVIAVAGKAGNTGEPAPFVFDLVIG